jgi:hypothetical protein
MDFGSQAFPKCGICGCQALAHYKKGELQGDVICGACSLLFRYDEDQDGYVR